MSENTIQARAAYLLGLVRGGHMSRATANARLRDHLEGELLRPERLHHKVRDRTTARYRLAVIDRARGVLEALKTPEVRGLLGALTLEYYRNRAAALTASKETA